MSEAAKTLIFVDGNCVVCSLEINHYKKIAPELFDLVDISDPRFSGQNFGLGARDVQFYMHVQTPDGEILDGVEAFAHIWSRIPRYRWASQLIAVAPVKFFAKIGYHAFAHIRPWLPKKKSS
jgi:predicted DCC family thiol-disulfide oxidoreductase YuxK